MGTTGTSQKHSMESGEPMSGFTTMMGTTTAPANRVISEELPVDSEIADRAVHTIENTSAAPQTAPIMVLKEPKRLDDTPSKVLNGKLVLEG